jgi:hypothetical protein
MLESGWLPWGKELGMQKKFVLFSAAAVVLAGGLIYFMGVYPPSSTRDAQGAIGQRQVYRDAQAHDSAVTPGSAPVAASTLSAEQTKKLQDISSQVVAAFIEKLNSDFSSDLHAQLIALLAHSELQADLHQQMASELARNFSTEFASAIHMSLAEAIQADLVHAVQAGQLNADFRNQMVSQVASAAAAEFRQNMTSQVAQGIMNQFHMNFHNSIAAGAVSQFSSNIAHSMAPGIASQIHMSLAHSMSSQFARY